MFYAFDEFDVTYGQSNVTTKRYAEYLGSFESQDDAYDAFRSYNDERLEAEIAGGSKFRNFEFHNDYYSFDYWPNSGYSWIHEEHWLIVYRK